MITEQFKWWELPIIRDVLNYNNTDYIVMGIFFVVVIMIFYKNYKDTK